MAAFGLDDVGGSSLSSAPELDKVAPFLIKLFEIVSSPASDDLVCWSEHGETFKIVHRTKFAGVRAALLVPFARVGPPTT